MSLSLAQLLTPSSEEQSLSTILDILQGLGFSARSWQSGSIARTLVQLLARLHSSASNTTLTITKGRYNDLAAGEWLSLLSASQFANTRVPAVAARINVKIDDSANAVGPFSANVGDLVATDNNGVSYRNAQALTLAQGASATLWFDAEVPGLTAEPISVSLSTPLAGTSTSFFGTQRPGANEEADERLRLRNRAKWASLAYAAPVDAYKAWALEASASVTRVWVDDLNTLGTGRVDVYIAGASGALPPPVATTVTNYIKGQVDGIYRLPLGVDLHVLSAVNDSVVVTGHLYSQPAADLATVQARANKAVVDYIASLPVGGTVLIAELYRRLMSVEGVTNVNLTVPSSDYTTAAGRVPVGAPSFVSTH